MINKLDRNDNIIVMIDKINEIIDFLNNTYLMKEKDGQDIFLTGTTIVDNNIAETLEPIRGQAVCPHCGASYYTELYSTSTAVSYPRTYKNGVNINPDRNQTTTLYECLACRQKFSI
jgi:hypothetical protein